MTGLKSIEAHTDGACLGNPGPGGWGVLLRYGAHERELSGGEPATTNNRMELMAAIAALEAEAGEVGGEAADRLGLDHSHFRTSANAGRTSRHAGFIIED